MLVWVEAGPGSAGLAVRGGRRPAGACVRVAAGRTGEGPVPCRPGLGRRWPPGVVVLHGGPSASRGVG